MYKEDINSIRESINKNAVNFLFQIVFGLKLTCQFFNCIKDYL